MGVRLFDQKFGVDLVRELPRAPGVYLFRDAEGRVLYAGKAKDLRRRLAGYRTASRRKTHRKMRTLVREAASLEVRPQESEKQALLLENPPWGSPWGLDITFIRGPCARTQPETPICTCAQNNTEPEWNFLHALERYAKERDARLVVIPMRYANPTSKRDPQEEKSEDYWWHEALDEYLVENELRIHQHLRIMGDVRIQATAVHPLSGLESRSRDGSAIYGHPQLAMQSVATPQHRLPKLL